MPVPRISPVLNNCSLHALTPAITAEIKRLAADPRRNNHHNEAYKQLKDCFASYYQFESGLTWADFDKLLSSYDAHDVQIMMGPVLREFLGERFNKLDGETKFIAALGNDMEDVEQYIQSRRSILKETSRYRDLSPDEMSAYVSQPLGISITGYHNGRRGIPLEAENPVDTVNLYHEGSTAGALGGGHWELSNNKSDIINFEKDPKNQLKSIVGLLQSDNNQAVETGIELLKRHVKLSHQRLSHPVDERLAKDNADIILAAYQIGYSLGAMLTLTKEQVKRAVGEKIMPTTAGFIDRYLQEEVFEGDFPAPFRLEDDIAFRRYEELRLRAGAAAGAEVDRPHAATKVDNPRDDFVDSIDNLVSELRSDLEKVCLTKEGVALNSKQIEGLKSVHQSLCNKLGQVLDGTCKDEDVTKGFKEVYRKYMLKFSSFMVGEENRVRFHEKMLQIGQLIIKAEVGIARGTPSPPTAPSPR